MEVLYIVYISCIYVYHYKNWHILYVDNVIILRTALRMNVKKTLSEGLSDRHIKYREDGHQLIYDSKFTEKILLASINKI